MSGATPRNVFNLNVQKIPMVKDQINVIDIEMALKEIKIHKPKLVILGGSVLIKNWK